MEPLFSVLYVTALQGSVYRCMLIGLQLQGGNVVNDQVAPVQLVLDR